MGMVPWILRDSVQAEPASGNWSPESLLSVLARPGSSASESALKGRAILILESEPWDLSKEEEQLLMAMLRSIGLAQNDLCRTTMASGTNEAGQHLVSLFFRGTRADVRFCCSGMAIAASCASDSRA